MKAYYVSDIVLDTLQGLSLLTPSPGKTFSEYYSLCFSE